MKILDKIMKLLGYRPEPTYSVSAKLIKADGTVQDLGVIGKAKGSFTSGAGSSTTELKGE